MSALQHPTARLSHFLHHIYGSLPTMTHVKVEVEALSGGSFGTPHLEATCVRVYAGSEELLPQVKESSYWETLLADDPTLFAACHSSQAFLEVVQRVLFEERTFLSYGLDWPDCGGATPTSLFFTAEELRFWSSLEQPEEANRFLIPAAIKKLVLHLLLERDLWFLWFAVNNNQYALYLPGMHTEWFRTELACILESGLEDDDNECAWFRYQGTLISFVNGMVYWYRICFEATDEEKEFDVRDLKGWRELGLAHQKASGASSTQHLQMLIKAALQSGELCPASSFLHDRSDQDSN